MPFLNLIIVIHVINVNILLIVHLGHIYYHPLKPPNPSSFAGGGALLNAMQKREWVHTHFLFGFLFV